MEVSSSWTPESGINLCEIVQEVDELPAGDFVELLDEDKCVSLVPVPEHHPKECTIRFVPKCNGFGNPKDWPGENNGKIPRKKLLTGLKILSESRVMEISLGIHEEYYTTVHGVLMGDFGDSKMYVSEVKFDTPQDVVSIKLKGLCIDDSVWIYSLAVTVVLEVQGQGKDPHVGLCHNGSQFGKEHLSSVFKDKGVNLSKDAEKFYKMLEDFNSDQNNKFSCNNPMTLMSMMFGAGKSRNFSKDYELDLKNGNSYGEKEKFTVTKDNADVSKVFSMIGNRFSCDKGDELSSSRAKEHKFNNHNKENDLKLGLNSQTSTDAIVQREISSPMSNIIEQLQAFSCGDKLFTKEQHRYKSVIDMLSSANLDSYGSLNNTGVGESLHKGETNEENSLLSVCKCGRSREEYNEIGSLVDEKLAAFEERLLRKIEEKFEEHSKNESLKLKKIEELLSRISERL